MKESYKVYPWHNRGWWCYSYLDSWGNYHSEVKLPPPSEIIVMLRSGGGYGYDSWAVTRYLIRTGEVIASSHFGAESGCDVYRDETAIIKSMVKDLWAEKGHPKVDIYDLELFKQKFPLTYKIVKYLYCRKHLSWLSVKVYDKRYKSICD